MVVQGEVSEPASPGRNCSVQTLKRLHNSQQNLEIILEKEVLGNKGVGL